MPKPHWTRRDTRAVTYYKLASVRYLPELVGQELVDFPDYVWRGQRSEKWKLEPTLMRKAHETGQPIDHHRAAKHLGEFKQAALGRVRRAPDEEREWWALGQHHGLATPLLDWTSSPFVAAYFAFASRGFSQKGPRAIWGLSKSGVLECSRGIESEWKTKSSAPTVDLFRSSFGENVRLISQVGWFTKAPDGLDLETWVRRHAVKHLPESVLLFKITMPNSDREHCLKMLDRMNINHFSLFPDLDGAARYCNTFLEIDRYH